MSFFTTICVHFNGEIGFIPPCGLWITFLPMKRTRKRRTKKDSSLEAFCPFSLLLDYLTLVFKPVIAWSSHGPFHPEFHPLPDRCTSLSPCKEAHYGSFRNTWNGHIPDSTDDDNSSLNGIFLLIEGIRVMSDPLSWASVALKLIHELGLHLFLLHPRGDNRAKLVSQGHLKRSPHKIFLSHRQEEEDEASRVFMVTKVQCGLSCSIPSNPIQSCLSNGTASVSSSHCHIIQAGVVLYFLETFQFI